MDCPSNSVLYHSVHKLYEWKQVDLSAGAFDIMSKSTWSTGNAYAKDNRLQTYDVCRPQQATTPGSQQLWVIYIHGGYYRSINSTAEGFHGVVQALESSAPKQLLSTVSGYATIDYRLSPHPDHPQSDDTPDFELRNARWPQHLDDIVAAVKHLSDRYQFGPNYVLAGHSVGAQLAFLVALKAGENGFVAPRVVVGLSGIYDFPAIHEWNPEYKSLTFNAMNEDDQVDASPALHAKKEYAAAGVKKIVLAMSKDDGLVPWEQTEEMAEVLGSATVVEMFGEHDEIWQKGKEAARAIQVGLEEFVALK